MLKGACLPDELIFITIALGNGSPTAVSCQGGVEDHQDDAAVTVPIDHDGTQDDTEGPCLSLPQGCGLPVAEGGGLLSPLSGAYLLIVLSEPMSEEHKDKMLQKLRQGIFIIFFTMSGLNG